MKHDLTTGTWQDDTGCPISIVLAATSDVDTIRVNEIAIENSETGKVTAVVATLKVFGDTTHNSRSANPGNSLNKPNKRLNSKKKHLNRSLKRPNELNKSVRDISERLIVKQKTIRVLLDTGLSGDLLFI